MYNGYTPQQLCLMNQLQQLWAQHVYWTRFFIISTAEELGDLARSQTGFSKIPRILNIANQFQELLTQHLLIAADLVNAAKNGETEKADIARQKWYQNADEIARFLSSIQPCWSEARWKEMLYSHLQMTEQEAVLRLQGNYAADIEAFNAIENEALQMANYMFCGFLHSRVPRHRPCF